MGKKYIIELEEMIVSTADGQMPLYKIKGLNTPTFDSVSINKLTPYSESDLSAVRNEAYKEAYDKGYQDAVMKIDSNEHAIAEKAYQRGLNAAWEAARQISNMTLRTQKTIFSVEGMFDVIEKYSATEAIECIKKYESEKPEEYKFNPGDEIVYKTDHNIRVCVTSVNVGNWDGFALVDVKGVCTFGGSYLNRPFEDWEKTGRKVEILKKAKEKES